MYDAFRRVLDPFVLNHLALIKEQWCQTLSVYKPVDIVSVLILNPSSAVLFTIYRVSISGSIQCTKFNPELHIVADATESIRSGSSISPAVLIGIFAIFR